MDRRTFIKISAVTTGFSATGLTTACTTATQQLPADPLQQAFQNPPTEAKPFTRWWWNGNVINKQEIERELEVMQQAGIGGIEITPIAMPEEGEKIDADPVIWLSNEGLDILKFTCDKARQLDMQVDMIVGTGWPFGGDFLAEDETIQGVQQRVLAYEGPATFTIDEMLPETDYNTQLKQVKLIPADCQSINDVADLTDQVSDNHLNLEVPQGKHYLHIINWRQNYDEVYFGAPGGQGPVLDHFNREAVRKYLARTSEKLNEIFPEGIGTQIRSMFCDSIELYGANWTHDLSQEFEQRRGYSVEEYLPFILAPEQDYANISSVIVSARYDYYRTLSELFTERFLSEFHQWCQQIGVKSRYQAYGYPYLYTHMTDGGQVPDIPEGDQFLFNGAWQKYANINDIRYAVWNKYAAAGGKLAGRPIVSTEAMTNLKGVFQATLALHKQATDLDFAAGVNHLILHGYNYSPPEAGFPGWMRFGTYYSDQNTWWDHFPQWSRFTARVSAVLQKATPVAHIGLLSPIEDTWAQYGLDRNAYNYNPWYLHAIWQAFNHNGCQADYLSPSVVAQSTARNQKLSYRGVDFAALVVCSARFIRSDVAARLQELADQGVAIIFLDGLPQRTVDGQEQPQSNIFSNPSRFKTYPAPGEKEQASPQALADYTHQLIKSQGLEPLLQPDKPDEKFFFQQAVLGDQKVYYLVNASEKEDLQLRVQLPMASDESLVYYQAETGKIFNYPHQRGSIQINLLPTGSLLLVSGSPQAPEENYQIPDDELLVINPDAWQVSFLHHDGSQAERKMMNLEDISQLPDFTNFAGTIIYKGTFSLDRADWMYLDLQETTDSVEVIINGTSAGVRWHRGQLLSVNQLLKSGKNNIQLLLKTTLFNHARTLTDNAMAMKWVKMASNHSSVPTGLLKQPVLRTRKPQR